MTLKYLFYAVSLGSVVSLPGCDLFNTDSVAVSPDHNNLALKISNTPTTETAQLLAGKCCGGPTPSVVGAGLNVVLKVQHCSDGDCRANLRDITFHVSDPNVVLDYQHATGQYEEILNIPLVVKKEGRYVIEAIANDESTTAISFTVRTVQTVRILTITEKEHPTVLIDYPIRLYASFFDAMGEQLLGGTPLKITREDSGARIDYNVALGSRSDEVVYSGNKPGTVELTTAVGGKCEVRVVSLESVAHLVLVPLVSKNGDYGQFVASDWVALNNDPIWKSDRVGLQVRAMTKDEQPILGIPAMQQPWLENAGDQTILRPDKIETTQTFQDFPVFSFKALRNGETTIAVRWGDLREVHAFTVVESGI